MDFNLRDFDGIYVHFQNEDEAIGYFNFFETCFNVFPGDEMAAHYMKYPYAYVSRDDFNEDCTIEGYSRKHDFMEVVLDYPLFAASYTNTSPDTEIISIDESEIL